MNILVLSLLIPTCLTAVAIGIYWKSIQLEKMFIHHMSEIQKANLNYNNLLGIYNTLKMDTDTRLSEIQKNAVFQANAFTSYQNSLEERQTSIEGRQSAIEARQSGIETKHTELSGAHEELHDAIESLHENHSAISEDFDSISKAITEKSNPVYLQDKGQAVCSKCGHNVARYFHDGPSVVCANCDPVSFNDLVRG